MTTFKCRFCPGCGAEVEPQDAGASDRPLNDDTQLWSQLCADCFRKAYPDD